MNLKSGLGLRIGHIKFYRMKKVKKEESPIKKRKSDDDEYSPAKVDLNSV